MSDQPSNTMLDDAGHNPESADLANPRQAEAAELRDKLLRAQAEVRNVSRRLTDEKLTALRYANTEFARALLPALDNFERMLAGLAQTPDSDPFKMGAKLTYDLLAKALADHRITPIESIGRPFDPELHEAIRREESSQHPAGTVTTEYEKGYRIADRVLRAARVAIAVPPAGSDAEGTG